MLMKMKKYCWLLAMLLICNLIMACSQAPQDSQTPPNNQTQTSNIASSNEPKKIMSQHDLNVAAGNKSQQADDTINQVYNQILREYSDDKTFTDKLVDAELAWIEFRDAELEALYPYRREKGQQMYGSYFPTAFSNERTALILARTRQLREWLEGFQPDPKSDSIDYSKFTGSQAEINQSADKEAKKADNILNDVYNQILTSYKNKVFIDKFETAELAWIAFKDAELEAIKAASNKQKRYGDLYLAAYNIEKARLTWARVAQLKQWFDGVPEGFMGAGSRKMRVKE